MNNIKKSVKKQLEKEKTSFANYKWIFEVTLVAFILSFVFSMLSETIIPNVSVTIGVVVLAVFVILGIVFDIIGVAVTAADIAPFNSMNSRKIKGADIAVKFKQNAASVSSFCNDVIGDVCGVISGGAGSIIALNIANTYNLNTFYTVLIVSAIIASITIGGKALGKSYAINKSNIILYKFAKIISYFYKAKR